MLLGGLNFSSCFQIHPVTLQSKCRVKVPVLLQEMRISSHDQCPFGKQSIGYWVLNLCVLLKPEQNIEQGSAFLWDRQEKYFVYCIEHLPQHFSGEYNTPSLRWCDSGCACWGIHHVCGKSMCEAEIMYCHPVGLLQGCCGRTHLCLCSCCGGRAELTRIPLYTGPKVPGISHSLGICDMVDIQDLH